jgi:short-subunit dehydrogenase
MNILITGTSSGVGKGLRLALATSHNVIGLTRTDLDLSNVEQVSSFDLPVIDMLINCAGTDIGGKIEFTKHKTTEIVTIMNTNLLAPVLLSQKALQLNKNCKIVNITSTNNIKYYPNNLAYSLTKKSLESFTNMLQVEYPKANILEVRLGLTKTNFNQNRFKGHEERFNDIYSNKHLTVDEAVNQITNVLFNDSIRFVEVAP